ncbi:MAG: hypothetical protein PUB11_06905 [Oscillospiraceae bacterium]|nr:hypothetical protein [Oscillospiraceae bacterium]
MKRITSMFLTLAMMLSLAACGGDSTKTEGATNTGSSTKTETKKEMTFTEMVVVDNDECTIKITGLEENRKRDYTAKLLLENKTADKTLMFAVDNETVDGVCFTALFAKDVAAGKKANAEIRIKSDDLKDYGVSEYTDIELSFRVYDSNDWLADDVAKETVNIYPYGEENAVKFVRESRDTDNVIIDNENVTVIVTGYDKDGIWGYTVNLYLINKTDTGVMFCVDDASVNGYMVDPFYAKSVPAGKSAFSSMSWSNSALEENEIEEIETIEFKFRAYDNENWVNGDFANEIITLIH